MKNTRLKFAAIGAAIALLASLAFMFFTPRDFMGWEPVGILADTVFWPGFKVGTYVGNHWTHNAAGGWAAGILTMTLLGATIGLIVGTVACRPKRASESWPRFAPGFEIIRVHS